MTCNNCTHWNGERWGCELGPDQYMLCAQMTAVEKEEEYEADSEADSYHPEWGD